MFWSNKNKYDFRIIKTVKNNKNPNFLKLIKKLEKDSSFFDIIRTEENDFLVFSSFKADDKRKQMILEMFLYSFYAYYKSDDVKYLDDLIFKIKRTNHDYDLIHLRFNDTRS